MNRWVYLAFVIAMLWGCSDPPSPTVDEQPCGGACPADECVFGMCTGTPNNDPADMGMDGNDEPDAEPDAADEDVPEEDAEPDVEEDVEDDADDDVCEGDEGCGDGEICVDEACVEGCRDDEGCGDGEICADDACVAGCRVDESCGDDQICVDDACVEGCRDDEACGDDQICVDDACVDGCRDDEACGDGEICQDDACVAGCREDEACPDAQYCDTDALSCEDGCRRGGCPEGQVCSLDTRQCAEIPCEGDESCDAGQICVDDNCVEGCRNDDGCLEGEICQDSACVTGCRNDAVCGEGEICQDDVCTTGCRDDDACGDGEICQNNLCIGGCRNDTGCGEGEICEGEICVDGCREDEACGEGEICQGNTCTEGCREDEACGEGEICQDNTCVDGCRDDEVCNADQYCNTDELACATGCRRGGCPEGEVCDLDTRQCAAIPCEGDESCDAGQICVGETCVEGCRNDDGCLEGEICEGDACVAGCRGDEACGNGEICVDDACVDGCRGDEACGNGEICVDDACVDGCRDDDGCGEGEICTDNACVIGCRGDEACNDDQICVDDACVAGCRGDDACGEGEICLNDACVGGCRVDDVCGEGEICQDNVCTAGCRDNNACQPLEACVDNQCAALVCERDLECPQGAFCDGGQCAFGCRVDDECAEGEICQDGQCAEGCRTNTDCPEGQFCGETLQCEDGCRSDVECNDGEICSEDSRQCVAGCRADDGCAPEQYCDLEQGNPTEGVCAQGCRLRECPEFQVCDPDTRQCQGAGMCFGDNECGEGQICEPFFCVEGCRQDTDCADGLICDSEELFCRVGCREDQACQAGFFCDTEAEVCVEGCRGDEECGQNRSCLPVEIDGQITQQCVPTPCEGDGACDDGFFCDVEQGVCEPGCRPGDCPEGQFCDLNERACVLAPCEGDDACDDGQVCLDGDCIAGCRDDEGCPDNQTFCAVDRDAEFGQCEVGCRVDGCPGDQRCDTRTRQCTDSQCGLDTDCDAGFYCRDQVECVEGCRNDGECAGDEICDDLTRACVTGCREEDDGDDVCEDRQAQPRDLALGEPVEIEGRVCTQDVDHIAFRLLAGEELLVSVFDGSGLGDVTASLLGPDCEGEVARLGFEGDPDRLFFVAPEDGVYVLRVDTLGIEQTNAYTILAVRNVPACVEDASEPNNEPLDADVVDVPQGTEVEVNDLSVCTGDEDWYAILVEQPGNAIRATVVQDPTDPALEVAIYAPGGELVLDSNSDPGESRSAQTGSLGQGGVYLVRVTSTDDVPFSGTDYQLRVLVNLDANCIEDDLEPNDSLAEAALVDGGQYELSLCQGRDDTEVFLVELQPGDRFNLALTYDHDLVAPEDQLPMVLYGPGGPDDVRDFTLRDGQSDTDRLAFNPDGILINDGDAGIWVVEIESGSGLEAIDFLMDIIVEAPACEEEEELTPNENCGEAIRLQPGGSDNGFVCGPTRDEDWFVVEANPNRGLDIFMEHIHFEGNLEMEAYAADGETLLGFSYNAGPDFESIELEPGIDGDVCIRVFTQSRRVRNTYTIQTNLD